MESTDTLAKKYSKELFSYLCRYVGDYASAQDILSDVFVRMMENIHHSGDESFQWRPWLYRVATNLAASHLRRQKIRRLFLVKNSGSAINDSSPHRQLEYSQNEKRVRMAMEQLSNKYRSALVMRVYQEMSYEEIARNLGISLAAVKSRINDAKKKMAKIMGGAL